LNKSEKIRLYYGIFLSVLTAAVGIVFIVTIAQLYYSGKDAGLSVIYTVDRISEVLTLPLIFLFTWIAAIIGGFVLSVIFPVSAKRKGGVDEGSLLRRLKTKIPAEGGEEWAEAKANIKKLELIRIIAWAIALTVLAVSSVIIITFAFDEANYQEASQLQNMLAFVRSIIIWVGASLVCCVAATAFDIITVKKELTEVKKAIAKGDKNAMPKPVDKSQKFVTAMTAIYSALSLLAVVLFAAAPIVINKLVAAKVEALTFILVATLTVTLVIGGYVVKNIATKHVPHKAKSLTVMCSRIAVGAIAVAFIIIGITNGGAADVLAKAIAICTECIGLG